MANRRLNQRKAALLRGRNHTVSYKKLEVDKSRANLVYGAEDQLSKREQIIARLTKRP